MKWLSRVFIGIVFILNLQCAFTFLIDPITYVTSFELSGDAGKSFIQALGILFLMWNVPYFLALLDPHTYRISLLEAAVMQGIGFIGETLLFVNLPITHLVLRSSVLRFMIFDGSGFILLLIALGIVLKFIGTNKTALPGFRGTSD
jgi:hypothetical protein